MLTRCRNKNTDRYRFYGARGIKVCDRWLNFDNFLADMGERPIGMTIERKDTNGNYTPENCIWADKKQQHNNKRGNRIININGISKTMAQWSDISGIPLATIWWRLSRRWPTDKLLIPLIYNYLNGKRVNGINK